MTIRRLSLPQKREIFQHLVTVQDSKSMSVGDSYRHVGEHFGVSEDQVRTIAEEGLDKNWPPLGDAVEEVGVG